MKHFSCFNVFFVFSSPFSAIVIIVSFSSLTFSGLNGPPTWVRGYIIASKYMYMYMYVYVYVYVYVCVCVGFMCPLTRNCDIAYDNKYLKFDFGAKDYELSGLPKGWFPKGWFWRMPERGYIRMFRRNEFVSSRNCTRNSLKMSFCPYPIWLMEMNGRSSALYLARGPCVPLFCTLFK